MKRRALLRAVAATGPVWSATIAGCTGTDVPGDGTPGSPTETGGGTPTPTATATPTPTSGRTRLTGEEFTVLDSGCGTGSNRATVEWADRTVTVTGVISGRNGCYTAELKNARYVEDADELRVGVRSYNPNTEAACTQCIVDIEYRSTFEFEGGLPDTVVVGHNGERVERAESDSN